MVKEITEKTGKTTGGPRVPSLMRQESFDWMDEAFSAVNATPRLVRLGSGLA